MEFDRIIINYIEGKTTAEEEQQLFTTMAYDESLRRDFKEYQQINNAVKKGIAYFTPPTYVVNNLYRKLGYSIPSVQATNTFGRIFKNKRLLVGHALTALAAVILSVAVMLAFFIQTKTNNNKVEINNTGKNLIGISSQIPIVQSKENTVQNKKMVKQNSSVEILHDIMNEEEIEQTPEERNHGIHLAYSPIEQISNFNNKNSVVPKINLPFNNNMFPEHFLFKNWKPIGLTFGFNGSAVWNIPKATIPSNYVSPFSNLCLSIYYDISDNFRIGAEVRQESYYMEYTGTEQNNLAYIYHEQANFATYSANARYYPLEKRTFNPYLAFDVGFNKGGIVARPGVGLEYQVYPDLAFVLGLEGTRFWFTHQNNWFYTQKVGLNYGVLIGF